MESEKDYQSQFQAWERFYDRVAAVMDRYGKHDTLLGLGDYSIYDGYWGYPQVKISVANLKLIEPRVIDALQRCLLNYPGYEIVIAITLRGPGRNWPDMGLIVRAHEIIDGLQRQYFPKEFQRLQYPNSRRGTERD